MKKNGSKKSVELIRPFGMKKRDHAANVVETFDLRTERRFLVEVAVHEIAVFLRRNPAHSVNADATRMSDHLAHHVLRHFVLITADRDVTNTPLTPVSTVDQCKGFLRY